MLQICNIRTKRLISCSDFPTNFFQISEAYNYHKLDFLKLNVLVINLWYCLSILYFFFILSIVKFCTNLSCIWADPIQLCWCSMITVVFVSCHFITRNIVAPLSNSNHVGISIFLYSFTYQQVDSFFDANHFVSIQNHVIWLTDLTGTTNLLDLIFI